ncbi:MAG: hypothetical protein ACJ8DC_03415 [Gemmatimonadales bacterium]
MLWVVVVAAAVAACKGKDQASGQPGGQPAGQQGMGGMRMDSVPMGGGNIGMGGSAMMPMMRAHMDSMMRMSPEQMTSMMAAHDRMMSQMMDRMGSDMRNMKMSGDAKWNALVDSVKADLADLPSLQGRELPVRMKAHADRVQRLLAMHEGMMKGM